MVVTCPGGGYCWAVDKNGNFLNRMDGIGDPKMAGFKRIPDGPLGSRAVTVQKQGCTFRYYVGADGKVVSAFNPLFGQNNTPGQFRGTEPSNREATQTSQTATEQAGEVTVVENYFGFGPATKTAVACYTREFDTKAVKPPEKTVEFANNPDADRNGVVAQGLIVRNLKLLDCQMREVKLTKQEYSAFREVTMTYGYKRADGVIGNLVVEARIGTTIYGAPQDFRPGAFPIYPGDEVMIKILTIPNGSEEAHRKWLAGGDMEFRLIIGDFVKQPCSSAEIKKMFKEQTRVVIDGTKAFASVFRQGSR